MGKTSSALSEAAKQYLSNKVRPSPDSVRAFGDESAAVQLEVLTELRTNAHTSVEETDLTMLAAVLAVLAALVATLGLNTIDYGSAFKFDQYTGSDAVIAWLLFFVVSIVFAAMIVLPVSLLFMPHVFRAIKARAAATLLAAYSDELAHRWQAPGRRARRWRRTHSPFARCSP